MVKSESDIIDTIHTGQVITDENGTQYFVCGKNRIKISEHWKCQEMCSRETPKI